VDYTQAIRLDPDNAEAYAWRGVVYGLFDNKNCDQAIADCTQAIRLIPNNSLGYLARSIVYQYQVGDLDLAIADFQTALRIDPNDEFTKDLLKEARGQRGY
jgi:tetratricopeptide (TPR) repeat protein